MSIRIRMMIRLVPSIAPLLDVFDVTVAAVAIRVPRRGVRAKAGASVLSVQIEFT
ncbi:hypothetical protein LGM65_21025 [Burkholderia anthina]|uniref:hypothetical protein n=1 Tax=Burkholderia anthina TaxID=179879 RepID=UPI001CF4D35A|nr:hypothetical protein [Burkholderia anthina]MCA8093338.1 hypothetical protein [Burkholderia anthina]